MSDVQVSMDNPSITWGKWEEWMHELDNETDWKSQFLSEWPASNDAVYTREEVERWLASGRIDKKGAERMMRMRYKVNRKGERVIEDRERDDD
jgi:predicted metal-dependent RNase